MHRKEATNIDRICRSFQFNSPMMYVCVCVCVNVNTWNSCILMEMDSAKDELRIIDSSVTVQICGKL